MTETKSLAVIGDDLEALFDTRDGCEDPAMLAEIDIAIAWAAQDLSKKVDSTAYMLSKWASEADRFKAEADRLYVKSNALKMRSTWLKGTILQFLKSHGQPELKGEFNRFVIAKNPPALNITDADIIPAKYIELVPATTRIHNDELKAALKLGVIVPGAELTRGERIERK